MPRLIVIAMLALAGAQPFPAASADGADFTIQDGDRVALVGATLLERDRHYGYFETVLRTRFPGVRLDFRNMAWPGDTTTVQMRPLNFGSFEDHIARVRPTVALVSYGSNEAFEGPDRLDSFLDGYRRILDVLEQTCRQIVLVSPVRHENLGSPLPDPTEHNGNLEMYVTAIGKLADERGYPFVDLFHTLAQPSDEPPAYPLTENGIHLNEYGYWQAAHTLADELGLPAAECSLSIAAGQEALQSRGIEVTALQRSGEAIRFKATALQLPSPPPDGAPHHAPAAVARQTIRATGLEPGRYVLKIDGRPVAVATGKQWAAGVGITGGPDFDQVRELREEVRWKNLLFFHRWRAHNGEYIYGRRSETSAGWRPDKDGGNSGNPTFPKEMSELERLINLSDRKAGRLSQPRIHAHELVAE